MNINGRYYSAAVLSIAAGLGVASLAVELFDRDVRTITEFCQGLSKDIKKELGGSVDDHNISAKMVDEDGCRLSSDNAGEMFFLSDELDAYGTLKGSTAGERYESIIKRAALSEKFCAAFNKVVVPAIAESGAKSALAAVYDGGKCTMIVNGEGETPLSGYGYNVEEIRSAFNVQYVADSILADMPPEDRQIVADNLPTLINSAFD